MSDGRRRVDRVRPLLQHALKYREHDERDHPAVPATRCGLALRGV
jgi:hypothetical protein